MNRKLRIVSRHQLLPNILRRQLNGTNSYSGNESELDCQH
jgi:hypothetical protein